MNWTTGSANLNLIPKSSGQTTITVNLIGDSNNILYQKSFDVSVEMEKGNINFSKDVITLNLTDKKTETVELTWDFKTGAQIVPDYDPDVVSVTCDNVSSNSMRVTFAALKSGTTVAEFSIVDASNNKMGSAKTTITVQEKKQFSINYESDSYILTANQQKNILFDFAGDGIASMDYSSSDRNICDAEWGDVDWTNGIANLKLIPNSSGQATITVIMLDDNKNILYQKDLNVTVEIEKGTIKFSKDAMTLDLTDKKSEIIDLTWDFTSGVQIIPNYDPNIVSVTYDSVTTNSMRVTFEALKVGSTVAEFSIIDGSMNNIGSAKLSITVEDEKNDNELTQNEKIYSINFESESYTLMANQQQDITFGFKGDGIASMDFSSSNGDICDVEWSNVDWTNGVAKLNIIPKRSGNTAITVFMKDDNKVTLYQKSFNVNVTENANTTVFESATESTENDKADEKIIDTETAKIDFNDVNDETENTEENTTSTDPIIAENIIDNDEYDKVDEISMNEDSSNNQNAINEEQDDSKKEHSTGNNAVEKNNNTSNANTKGYLRQLYDYANEIGLTDTLRDWAIKKLARYKFW